VLTEGNDAVTQLVPRPVGPPLPPLPPPLWGVCRITCIGVGGWEKRMLDYGAVQYGVRGRGKTSSW